MWATSTWPGSSRTAPSGSDVDLGSTVRFMDVAR
jgi:hypothetical protein